MDDVLAAYRAETGPMEAKTPPPGAIGYIGHRRDRPSRWALFKADGSLSNTFGRDDTLEDVRAALRAFGMVATDDGFVFFKEH